MRTPELAHYRPWIEDLRKDKPHQLEDRVEQLFHEKSQSGYTAWNRLFDQTISGLRFKLAGRELAIEPTLILLQDRAPEKRRAAAQALARTFKANERTFTLITNTLAKDKEIGDRWRGFRDVADSRHLANRVEREVVDALVDSVRSAYPRLSHRYCRLKASWLNKKKLPHWDRNAPLPFAATGNISWPEAKNMVLTAYRGFSPRMADVARRFCFYRYSPGLRWVNAIHEKIEGLDGDARVLPYVYHHYGNVVPPAALAKKYRAYYALGNPVASPPPDESAASTDMFVARAADVRPYRADHPRVVRATLSALEREFSSDFARIDAGFREHRTLAMRVAATLRGGNESLRVALRRLEHPGLYRAPSRGR